MDHASERVCHQSLMGLLLAMVDLKLEVPASGKVEVDAETLAAIGRGIRDADEGRTVPIDEVLAMIPKWTSKFEPRKPL